MQLILNVPDESTMAQEIAGWQDGVEYSFRATQTAPNTFDVTEATQAEPMAEPELAPEVAPAAPAHKNPAIAIVIGAKGKKS